MKGNEGLALVLSGGGARAAYQAGFLHGMARQFPELQLPVLVGVSAGAINAVHLANHTGDFLQATKDLCDIWLDVTTAKVFRVDLRSLLANVARWSTHLLTGGLPGSPQVRGLVDTAPLRIFLTNALQSVNGKLSGIDKNLQQRKLRAVAITTTSYTTGRTVTWVQGEAIKLWERPLRRSFQTEITVEHVMASAALPIFFPAIKLNNAWHGDGGIRLAAPLSPAIHLGADRILAVSTLCEQGLPDQTESTEYPQPVQILSLLLDAIFLDTLSYDAHLLRRSNQLLMELPEEKRRGLRPIELHVARPACDIGQLAAQFESKLPNAFRYLIRGIGTHKADQVDSLSMILFEPEYISKLIEAGESDARQQAAKLACLLNCE